MQYKKYKPKGNFVEAAVADSVGGLPNRGGHYGPGQVIVRRKVVDKRLTADNGAFAHKDVDTFEYEVVEAAQFLNDFEEVSEVEPKGDAEKPVEEPKEVVEQEPVKAE